MEIILNGSVFHFSPLSQLLPQVSNYDLDLVEPDFDKETEEYVIGGVDARLKLPSEIEATVCRPDRHLLPVARIYKDGKGRMRLSAYFD